MTLLIKYVWVSLLLMSGLRAFGQLSVPVDTLVQSLDAYRRQTLSEKLFVHTDQNAYLTGETLWFKLYYVDATFHKPLDLSKVAYVDILDGAGKAVLQTKVALTTDGGKGTFFLPASIISGTYRLRAYTNWMKNAGADYFFEKKLTVVNPFRRLGLPLRRESADYTVGFFPEGGNLVQGIPGKVAFKVTDQGGRGVAVRGWVLRGQQDTLVRFSTHKFGIGHFLITPSDTAGYRVVLMDSTGRSVTHSLPRIYRQGYAMRLEEAGDDQLKITVRTPAAAPSVVYLVAHTRQVIGQAEARPIQGETTFVVDKKALGEGVSHLTIFDAERRPVCERLYFKRPAHPLAISLKTDRPDYAPRTSVSITASVRAATPAARQATLSMAVYRLDSLASLGSGTILSYLWMTSDLPGPIESPDYYWQTETPDVRQATDNLMLTHGWRRFRWDDVLTPLAGDPSTRRRALRWLPEHNGIIVEGSVTDPVSGKRVPNVLTYLSAPGKPVRLYASRSDSLGLVRFEMQDFHGPKTLIAQPKPADSLLKLTIESPFATVVPAGPVPEVAVAESQRDHLLSRSVAMQVQSTYWGDRVLKYQYPLVDSTAFYGKGTESYLLDAYTRFPRMEEVLREYVLGVMPRKKQGHFQLHVLNEPYREIFNELSLVLIDGVPVFDIDKVMEFSPLKVQRMDVVTNRYLFGPVMFNGIVSLTTYKSDLAGFPLEPYLLKVDYDGLQFQREFYAPRYETARQLESRLPDARTLLYWNPSLQTDATGQSQVQFFTSDQSGTYLVEVNGLTRYGSAGSQRMLFEVKNTLK